MIKQLGLAALAMLGIFAASQSFAGSVTSTMQATATISSSCLISANAMAFGSFQPAATGSVLANSTVTATCSNNVPYTLSLSAGGGTIPARQMSGAIGGNTDKLAYNIYTTSALTTVFGNGTGSATIPGTGNGSQQVVTIYGSLAQSQFVTPDSYTDALTVTVAY